jgi:DNA-binding LacI/PurR family transcriptional regulator
MAGNITLVRAHAKAKARIRANLGVRWGAGDRLPPITELAEQLDVGRATAYKAVRELVSEGVLVCAPKLGTFVHDHYQQDQSSVATAPASPIAGKRIALLWTEPAVDEFVEQMVRGFTDTVTQRGGIIENTAIFASESPGQLAQRFRDLAPAAYDALVVINGPTVVTPASDRELLLCISTAAGVRVTHGSRYDIVSVDHEQGAALAGARMRRTACESVCFIGVRGADGARYDATSTLRLRGFEHGWGGAVPESHCMVARWYDIAEAGSLAAQWMAMPHRPRAIFAASDELAIGFIVGAAAHGQVAGRDFHIVGFDAQQAARRLQAGSLTSVAVPAREMGQMGARLLISRFEEPDQAVRRLALGCSLFEGATG